MYSQEFYDIYKRFNAIIDKWLIRSVWIMLILLIIIQGLLRIQTIRHAIVKVEQLEGVPYEYKIEDDISKL